MNTRFALVSIIAVIGLTACGSQDGSGTTEAVKLETDAPAAANCPAADESGNIEVAAGLSARILKTGFGRAAVVGDYADTNVWLWLYDETAEDSHGKFIWESGSNVFQFQLGAGQVIKGWDLGVPCMIEGETRELVVAGDLAYGPSGRGEIPPNATLIFTIELLKLTASQ
jgi:FKBP-type peptidyl-prolyl cis-trans isomerase